MPGLFNSLASFPKNQAAVTPSDTGLPRPGIIECLTDGNLVAKDRNGNSITRAMTAGSICPVYVTHVMAASTGTYCVLWD